MQTPFCTLFVYSFVDEEVNMHRLRYGDDSVEARYIYLDTFAKEYGWTKDVVYKLKCTERTYLLGLIKKRREKEGGMNAFTQ